ncbi:MAG: hypothetical protein PHS24_00395, partial [Bacilli bacterium]|nr:hypothetical protein [Bacilli bacterium]
MINLFSKDKELILKITNGILLIWFLAALIFTGNNLVNILVKEPGYTFEEYKTEYCNYKYENEIKDDCKNMYNNFNTEGKRENFNQKRNLYTSIINVV